MKSNFHIDNQAYKSKMADMKSETRSTYKKHKAKKISKKKNYLTEQHQKDKIR